MCLVQVKNFQHVINYLNSYVISTFFNWFQLDFILVYLELTFPL